MFSRSAIRCRMKFVFNRCAATPAAPSISSLSFSCQFLDRKICWEFHDHQARFAGLLSDQLLAKFRQKIISREVQPEFFASLQIFVGLRRDLANRLAIHRTLEIKHRKIAHLQSTSWQIDKI